MTIDVHPSMRDKQKGDALTSRGLCTVTLLGVWSWRGTNEHGGKTALPIWEYIALEERRVFVAFDSDVVLEPQVYAAIERLKQFLKGRGAEVQVIYLPHGEGKKQGVDDYLVAGHSVEDLLDYATSELREPPSGEDAIPAEPYVATPGGIVWNKPSRYGSTPFTTFTAETVGDIVEDDGIEERQSFEIEARLSERQRRFEVPATRFASTNWVAENLGAAAFVHAGFGFRDHASVAIRMLSQDIAERRVFAHTGWREMDGEWAYVHAGSAIGLAGSIWGVEVSMADVRLGNYVLPHPATGEDLARAVNASLRLLDLAPSEKANPMLAAAYRSPLGEAVPLDLSVYVAGPTGAFKTELTAITQAHYGSGFNGHAWQLVLHREYTREASFRAQGVYLVEAVLEDRKGHGDRDRDEAEQCRVGHEV